MVEKQLSTIEKDSVTSLIKCDKIDQVIICHGRFSTEKKFYAISKISLQLVSQRKNKKKGQFDNKIHGS
jgi:hypothetical protein